MATLEMPSFIRSRWMVYLVRMDGDAGFPIRFLDVCGSDKEMHVHLAILAVRPQHLVHGTQQCSYVPCLPFRPVHHLRMSTTVRIQLETRCIQVLFGLFYFLECGKREHFTSKVSTKGYTRFVADSEQNLLRQIGVVNSGLPSVFQDPFLWLELFFSFDS